ncbi:MAG: ferrochelatase [Candidatus Sumerlaeia bacterium]
MEPSNPELTGSPIGVLVCNLGTPAAPTAEAVRAYLREFLTDPMVVQPPPPRWVWRIILETMILPGRPGRVAEKYAAIWTPEGSPLLVNSRRIAAALEHRLINEIGSPLSVEPAMRYGEPSIEHGVGALRGCGKLVILPLFPQSSDATTGSVFNVIGRSGLRPDSFNPGVGSETRPTIKIPHYYNEPLYIDAIAESIREHWDAHGRPEQLLISFHGMPRRYADSDDYATQCRKTASLIAGRLDLADADWQLCYQSRFGRGAWLEPYTFEVIKHLGHSHAKRVDVIAPGFAADCLETLHELAIEGRELFQSAGGGEYHYIRALNDRPDHIAALAGVVRKALGGGKENR